MLVVTLNGTNAFPCCDGNGNVMALVDESGAVVASYEYSPFGECLQATGPLAAANPWRFSTRYYETETGLGMYPRRPYSPELGRFLSRDPIGEDGGNNLCVFAHNDPQNFFDPLGNDASSLPSLGAGDNSQIVVDEAKVSCRACVIGKLCIRVESPEAPLLDQLSQLASSKGMKGGDDPGHTFLLGILRAQGGVETREGVGFWPDNSQSQWAFFGGYQGQFRDDTRHVWTHQICFSMCPETWAQIKDHESYRPIYNVFVTQCTTWALVVTKDVGFNHGFSMMRATRPDEVAKYSSARQFLVGKHPALNNVLPSNVAQTASEPFELARMPGFSPH